MTLTCGPGQQDGEAGQVDGGEGPEHGVPGHGAQRAAALPGGEGGEVASLGGGHALAAIIDSQMYLRYYSPSFTRLRRSRCS